MNILTFGLPFAAYMNPTAYGGDGGLNLVYWYANLIFFEGKMRTIFSMLFGAGVVLMTWRGEERGGGISVADIYYRRTLWLVLFGMLHAYFIWFGDILYMYGMLGLALFPLRKAKPKALLIAGAHGHRPRAWVVHHRDGEQAGHVRNVAVELSPRRRRVGGSDTLTRAL